MRFARLKVQARCVIAAAERGAMRSDKGTVVSTLAIAYRKLGEFKPYARNARTHSRAQIRQIANSIERFGFTNSILIDDDDQIIAGHGRAAAAKLLKLDEVPTVRLSHLGPAERRAYVLADNRLAEKAGWDREILAIELPESDRSRFRPRTNRVRDGRGRCHPGRHRRRKTRSLRAGRQRPRTAFTISIRPGAPSLIVVDEKAIPQDFFEPREPKLNRMDLLAELKGGAAIAGVQLSNPEPVLSVRVR